jgi:hypothetical protein
MELGFLTKPQADLIPAIGGQVLVIPTASRLGTLAQSKPHPISWRVRTE